MKKGSKRTITKTEIRFPGMKRKYKNQEEKSRYKPVKKYGPFSYTGRLKPGLSDYQKRTMNKFMEVKEGETLEQWRKRTSRRRVLDDDEIEKLSVQNPIRVKVRKSAERKTKGLNKTIYPQAIVREFDFMRFYGIVINYFSIKYGIRKDDLEVGFYFYENVPFSKKRFENAMILHSGTHLRKFNRWINGGLLEPLLKLHKNPRTGEAKHLNTHLFKLNKHFAEKLTYIYRTLARMNDIRVKQPIFSPLSDEIKELIYNMNDEIRDIQLGRKPIEK